MTNNENWQGDSSKSNSGAGRDGKPFQRRDVRSDQKDFNGTGRFNDRNRNEDRPYRSNNSGYNNERRPYENRNQDRNNDGDFRPRFNPNRFDSNNDSGQRPRYNSGNDSDSRPRFSPNRFNSNEGSDSRPRYNNSGSGDSRSRNTGGGYQSRPRYNSEGGDSRPRFNSEGGDSRPRYHSGDDSRSRNTGGGYQSRPRYNNYDDDSRPRFTARKPGEAPTESKPYNKYGSDMEQTPGKRPRFRRPSEDYDPNAKYSKKKQFEYRRNEVDLSKPIRLNKFLANAGICSRREADEFIKAGVISVNGEMVSEMGIKVMHTDKVLFHNQLVRSERKVYILLNKPKDTVTTSEDTHDRRTVLDLVKNACSERIYPVGRLDRNTTGVLLLTNDGDLASRLTHPKYDKKKIYHVALDRQLERQDYEQILAGVKLDDELTIAADELNFVKEDDLKQVGIEIHSGQNRVVRRIFEALGYKVVRLDRVFFSGLTKKGLTRGKYRFLTEREVNMLKMGAYE